MLKSFDMKNYRCLIVLIFIAFLSCEKIQPDFADYMDTFEIKGSSMTRSFNKKVTDSAAGGTALSSGIRTANSAVGVYPVDKTPKYSYPKSITELCMERGMLTGVVTSVSFLGVHYEIIVDIGGFKWMIQTTDEHFVDDKVGLYIEPDAIHIMKKSEYSGLYGDYSSYSEEIDHLSDPEEVAD